MKSLNENCINVYDAFLVIFSLKISLTFMKLCNCMFTYWNQCWEIESSVFKLYLCFFLIEMFRNIIFLKIEKWEISLSISIKWACMILHAHQVFHILLSSQLCSMIWFCSLFRWTCSEDVYVLTFSILIFTFLKMLITWCNTWFWRAFSLHFIFNNLSFLSHWCYINALNIISDFIIAEYICLTFVNVTSQVKTLS